MQGTNTGEKAGQWDKKKTWCTWLELEWGQGTVKTELTLYWDEPLLGPGMKVGTRIMVARISFSLLWTQPIDLTSEGKKM